MKKFCFSPLTAECSLVLGQEKTYLIEPPSSDGHHQRDLQELTEAASSAKSVSGSVHGAAQVASGASQNLRGSSGMEVAGSWNG